MRKGNSLPRFLPERRSLSRLWQDSDPLTKLSIWAWAIYVFAWTWGFSILMMGK